MNYLIRKTMFGMYWCEVFDNSGLVFYIGAEYYTSGIAERGAIEFIAALRRDR